MTLPASIRLALRIICLLPGLALSLPAPAAGQQLLFEDFALDSGAFSPNGDGIQDHLLITVRLNQAGYLRVQVDSSDVPIRTLLDSVAVGTGAVELIWNGTADPAGLDPRLVSEGDYTVKAAAWSGTQSIVADPLDLVLDITAPVHTSTLFVEGDTLVRDGESIQLETTWNGDDYRIRPDFTAVDSDTLGGLQMMESGTTTRFQYTLSFYNTTADADSLPVPITAVDPAGNTAVDTTILLNLHNTPIPLGSVLADSSSCISDEWSIVIKTRWDRDDLSIVPDFAHIDNGLPGPYTVYPEGGGLYTIQYTTSENNTTPDADSLVVGLTASTRFGDRFTDNSLRLTMNNHPPVHIATRLINAKTVFKNSDTLK
ncbi:MAG: hypothetical protein KJ831_17740, partial [Candidatus Eisenbacteria bacterium]|nr:hypothetical protein [Candidatus Eisenbacteria bacterium]